MYEGRYCLVIIHLSYFLLAIAKFKKRKTKTARSLSLRDLYLTPGSVIYSFGSVSPESAAGVLWLASSLLMFCDQWCTGIGNGEPFKCKINYLQSDSIRETQHVFYA